MTSSISSPSSLGNHTATDFLTLSTPDQNTAFVYELGQTVSRVDRASQWFLNTSTHAEFIEILYYLTVDELRELSKLLSCPISFSQCFRWIKENISDPEKRYNKAECLYQLIQPSLLTLWKNTKLINSFFISFLIARLPEREKIAYLKSLLRDYPHNLHLLFDSIALAFFWSPNSRHQCHLARLVIQSFSPSVLKEALSNFSHKAPHLLFLFHVNLPQERLTSLYAQSIHPPIVNAYASTSLTNFREFNLLLKHACENGLTPLFLNTLRVIFSAPIVGRQHLSLTQLPSILGSSSYAPDQEGFDNFSLTYRSGIQRIPPVLIGIGARHPQLSVWLIQGCRTLTPYQITCLIWGLPFNQIKHHLETLLEHLDEDILEAALKALPPLLRNSKLDQKMREATYTLFDGTRILSQLGSDSTQLPLASHWEYQLNYLLSHPNSLPFWRAAANYHPLCCLNAPLRTLSKNFHDKRTELQTLTSKEIDREPTLKMAPPSYLTQDLLSKLGNAELEKVGIRKQSDLDTLGVTLEAINHFNQLERDLLDDLPILQSYEWEKIKWQNHPPLLNRFFQKNNRTPPEGLQNPFAPLQRYLRQTNLAQCWEKLHQKQIYSLGQIEENCLIEKPEDLFHLENLVAKLS